MIAVLAVSSLYIFILYAMEPFATLLSAGFHQGVLTRIGVVSGVANVLLSLGAIWIPTALFVAVKNALVALVSLLLTAGYAVTIFRLKYAT